MGDFLSPKRRDVVDRLRRRIERYRRHQIGCLGRFDSGIKGLYEQHCQDTLLLRQRWLETKAKKAAKHSKANKDTSNQGEHRNLIVTQRLKKKIDNSGTVENPSTDGGGAYSFDEQDSPAAKGNLSASSAVDSQLPSLSVQIVQKINPQQENSQTIHTNVTVSSTLKTCYNSTDSPKAGNSHTASIHTSVECKQEPTEDSHCFEASQTNSGQNNVSAFGVDDVEDLQDILDTLEKEEGEIPPEIIKELDKFNEIYDNVKVQRDSEGNDSGSMFGPMTSGSPGLSKGQYPDSVGPGSGMNPIYDNNQNMNTVASAPIPNIRGPTSHHVGQISGDATGPAAETLKQMAAHHQNQAAPPYPIKSALDPYVDPIQDTNYQRGNGYPNYQQQNFTSVQQSQQSASSFPYSQQNRMPEAQGHPQTAQSQVQYPPHMQSKQDLASLSYGGTKRLSHYPDPQNPQQSQQPSSLQQLQNQVRTHFNQPPNQQINITQSQHMHVSHGTHRMQMSQTQQLQMQQPPQNISLSQQQSFSMTSHMPPNQSQMMNEQMNMQMLEKMRQEQRQMQLLEQQQQQQQAQQNQIPPQYMSRPPPEYKIQPGASYANGTAPNHPLRTMQNMVNQTAAFGAVKSEVASAQAQNGIMQTAHMTAMQSMSATVTGNGPAAMTGMPQAAQGARAGHSQMPRPPSYPPGSVQNPSQASVRPQTSSTYTSAIMRNQRPPNVNVGPDGLNISQPRTHHEWPRPMMQPHGARHAVPGAAAMNQAAAMSASNMMQYGHYPNNAASGMNAGTMQMQQQQQRPPQMNSVPNQAAMMQNGAQVMMQQNMQLSQRVSMRPGAPTAQPASYNMSSVAMAGNAPANSAQAQGGYPNTSSAQDDFMNFLDNAQNTSPDFFDSISLQNSGTSDFNLLDEILGK